MADRKLSASTAITGANVDKANDLFMVLDVSDTTDAASGTNKAITPNEVNNIIRFTTLVKGTTPNRRHCAQNTNIAPGTVALVINTLRVHGLEICATTVIDKLGIEITTGTSGNMRVVLYNDDGTGQPSSLVAESGQLTVTTPGVYEGLSVASVTLQPGLYHIGIMTDTANTIRTMGNGAAEVHYGMVSTIGTTPMATMMTVSQTYGAAPTTFPGGATYLTGNPYLLFYRSI